MIIVVSGLIFFMILIIKKIESVFKKKVIENSIY
jgi:hypothetical protein